MSEYAEALKEGRGEEIIYNIFMYEILKHKNNLN